MSLTVMRDVSSLTSCSTEKSQHLHSIYDSMTKPTMMLSILTLLLCSFCNAKILDGLPENLRTDQWVSLDGNGRSFHPPTNEDATIEEPRLLREVQNRFLSEADRTADSYGTYYDGYSQAWRYLGFYIDCGEDDGDDHHRRLEGSNDDDEGGCKRMLLWAAYVDVDYQGGEIGEYQFYDLETDAWDTTPCNMTNSARCAKMDCHLEDTHFKLLGYFKEENYLEWMEQLFKHQGYCIWDDNDYNFMQTYYYSWPEECLQSKTTHNGDYLYVDLQPTNKGGMTLHLYTDSRCRSEFTGRSPTVASVIYDYYGSNASPYDIMDQMDSWNKGMDAYKICQPCRAYKLSYKFDDGDGNKRGLESGDGDFECDDDAGYQNVNQCMKFATHTKMRAATFNDLTLAAQQRSMIGMTIAGVAYGQQLYKEKEDYTFLLYSLGIFAGSTLFFWLTLATHRRVSKKKISEPFLEPSATGVQA